MESTTFVNQSEFSNAVAILCGKYSLDEQEFVNMLGALNDVTEEKQEAFVICAMITAKKTIADQMSIK